MNWPLLVGVACLVLIAVMVLIGRRQPNIGVLASHPHPAADYAEAVQRVTARRAMEDDRFNPLCHTRLLTHGQQTARAIALVHGYTNCPNQSLMLGQQFHDLGYNVLLVPMPHHGLADFMTNEPSRLTAEEMAAYADDLVDIARGLGQRVTLAGLSQGGVVAGWAAQTRADLDQAVLIAPGFGLKLVPTPLTVFTVNVVLALPEIYLWWDSLVRFKRAPPAPPGPDEVQGYPRFSVHGLAQQLRLGLAVLAQSRQSAPAAGEIIVITNGADLAVENSVTARLVTDWRAHHAHITAYEFPARHQIDHDMIDPHRDNQQTSLVYPKIIELINTLP